MLNKELLLVNSEKGLEYTHIITVGFNGLILGFNSEDDPTNGLVGDLQPRTLSGGLLDMLSTSVVVGVYAGTSILVKSYIPETALFLGRVDTKKVIHLEAQNVNNTEFYTEENFFNLKDDEGKTIKLWIAENPPPLGLEDSLGLFLKEALYVK